MMLVLLHVSLPDLTGTLRFAIIMYASIICLNDQAKCTYIIQSSQICAFGLIILSWSTSVMR